MVSIRSHQNLFEYFIAIKHYDVAAWYDNVTTDRIAVEPSISFNDTLWIPITVVRNLFTATFLSN